MWKSPSREIDGFIDVIIVAVDMSAGFGTDKDHAEPNPGSDAKISVPSGLPLIP
jgi:hypothetical protein